MNYIRLNVFFSINDLHRTAWSKHWHAGCMCPVDSFCGMRMLSACRILHKVINTFYWSHSPCKSHIIEVQINIQLLGINNIFLQFMKLQVTIANL